MFFVKPEVSVTQNHTQKSGPKFRLLIRIESVKNLILISDRLVNFDFLLFFLACLGLEPRILWAQSQQRRTTDQAAN
jgi:hypothetical protein